MEVQEILPYIEAESDMEPFRKFCLENCYKRERVHKGGSIPVPEIGGCGFLACRMLKSIFQHRKWYGAFNVVFGKRQSAAGWFRQKFL